MLKIHRESGLRQMTARYASHGPVLIIRAFLERSLWDLNFLDL
jgi:hypothetical protein